MLDLGAGSLWSEPDSRDCSEASAQWIEVLVDCPGLKELLTYRLPADLSVELGDVLSVPLGTQTVGGIAVRWRWSLPPQLSGVQLKEVEDVIASGLFERTYWQLLERVAHYYHTDLFVAMRAALPPGLLQRSQRRIRLRPQFLPENALSTCSGAAAAMLRLLMAQKGGDYSAQYLRRQVREASGGLRELLQRGWVESYLASPKPLRAKRQKAVLLVSDRPELELTPKQGEVLQVLRQRGGELWLSELLQISQVSSSVVESLARKGALLLEEREKLRLATSAAAADSAKTLNEAQARALGAIAQLQGYNQVLLHGVTGSGKTEVYLQAIAPVLDRGQSALVLVPEIGLTPQLSDRFQARFGHRVCIYHSALSEGERYDTWRQMLSGEPQVVIGTRSAIFAPLPRLGLLVLDEEHDSSFKQDQPAPTYHARLVAQWRAELAACPLILGSATPSLETWRAATATNPTVSYLSLPERIGARPLPPVAIADMRQELKSGNRSIFSRILATKLESLGEKGQQGILFIARRGHSTFVSCRSCGTVLECPHCDVSLSYHYTHEGATPLLRCHYCNFAQLQPRLCPACGSPYLKHFGSGTQRVALELQQRFPALRVLRFDSDTTRTKGAHRTLLTRFAKGEADVLVGTQMLTKGLDIAGVTLVGVVAADGLLHQSDYRAGERAFQILTQVAGRAGTGRGT
ncbi:MAG: primosomal protein N', partial [Chloroflexaceae bacterium]|nr:primosomal protein N' [Chloroflexaceae bacterium]